MGSSRCHGSVHTNQSGWSSSELYRRYRARISPCAIRFIQVNSLFLRKIPCSPQKIPCSARLRELGIGVQAFDLFDRLDTKNAKKGRIRKNSLLNSLFSGNLPPGVHPYRETQNKEQVALEAPVRASAGQTARYGANDHAVWVGSVTRPAACLGRAAPWRAPPYRRRHRAAAARTGRSSSPIPVRPA